MDARFITVDALLAEIESSGYGLGRSPLNRSVRDMAHQCRVLISEIVDAPADQLVAALEEIADEDYRGNRSPASEKAHRALVAAGLRSAA